MDGVIITAKSDNRKIGKGVAITMTAQVTCPSTCPFRKAGCYAENGPIGIHTARLNKTQLTADEVVENEANAIAELKDMPLRLHVVGDVTTDAQAQKLAKSTATRQFPAWLYTHGWRTIDPKSFGNINALASCESVADVKEANEKGYAAALVVEDFESTKAYKKEGLTILPCPEQTQGKTCATCRACWNANRLHERGITIAFKAHGASVRRIGRTLRVINGEE